MDDDVTPLKRKPGRPRKNPEETPAPKKKTWAMKAKPNWEEIDYDASESPDRLHIPPEMVPEGMSLQWVTTDVYGQPQSLHRANFEKRGWTPVHQSDFDGRFDGMFMPKGMEGEVRVEACVLMARPAELSKKASRADKRRAMESVMIKENQLLGGDLPNVSAADHPSAVRSNRINKTVERIQIPED